MEIKDKEIHDILRQNNTLFSGQNVGGARG